MKTLTPISICMAVLFGTPTFLSAEQALTISGFHFNTDCPHCTSKARRMINLKLDAILLDEVQFDSLPLGQVIETLHRKAKIDDPSQRGVNFIVSQNTDPLPSPHPTVDPVTGLAEPQAEMEAIDLSQVTIRIMPALTDVTLRQALDAVVKVADRPIKYSIEDYAVVFSWRASEPPALHTRWFRIDTNTFLQGVRGVTSMDFRAGSGGGGRSGGGGFRGAEAAENAGLIIVGGLLGRGFGIDQVAIVERGDQIISAARYIFTAAGVDFTLPGKQLFFNNRLRMLMVRATLQELDIIEQVMEVLTVSSPPATIEARAQGSLSRSVSRGAINGPTAESAKIIAANTAPNQPRDSELDWRNPGYREWLARYLRSDDSTVPPCPQVDSDRDGFPDLVEYAFGTSPVRADSVPRAEFVHVREGNEDYPAIQFRRRAKAKDLTYRVLFSSDLVNWNDGPSSMVAVSAPDAEGMEAVTIRSLTPMSGALQQFLRVELQVPYSTELTR